MSVDRRMSVRETSERRRHATLIGQLVDCDAIAAAARAEMKRTGSIILVGGYCHEFTGLHLQVTEEHLGPLLEAAPRR